MTFHVPNEILAAVISLIGVAVLGAVRSTYNRLKKVEDTLAAMHRHLHETTHIYKPKKHKEQNENDSDDTDS